MALGPDGKSDTPEPLSAIDRERMVLRHLADEGSKRIRVMGLVGMGLGLFLLLIIGAVAYFTVPIILAGGEEVDGTRFSGSSGAALLIFTIYGVVAAIGLLAMLNGALHVATGRRFSGPIRLMMGFASLLILAGMATRLLG